MLTPPERLERVPEGRASPGGRVSCAVEEPAPLNDLQARLVFPNPVRATRQCVLPHDRRKRLAGRASCPNRVRATGLVLAHPTVSTWSVCGVATARQVRSAFGRLVQCSRAPERPSGTHTWVARGVQAPYGPSVRLPPFANTSLNGVRA